MLLTSFIPEVTVKNQIIFDSIKERQNRYNILKSNAVFFNVGDILGVTFRKKNIIYRFEGICICKRKKALLQPDVSLILRNILLGVGIECTVSYYYNRVYKLQVLDHKRKKFIYNRSKLYYLRKKLNRASRIK